MNLCRQKLTLSLVSVAVGLMSTGVVAQQAEEIVDGSQLEFHLFQNFYTQPGASQTTAAMYNAPQPVPYWVGHSNYTYQPLYPHQHLHPHKKNYYSYYAPAAAFYPNCGSHPANYGSLNKTRVIWQSGNHHMGYFPFSSGAAQRALYALQAHRYCLKRGGASGCNSGGCR